MSQSAATAVWLAGIPENEVVGVEHGGCYWLRMARRLSSANMTSQEYPRAVVAKVGGGLWDWMEVTVAFKQNMWLSHLVTSVIQRERH